MLLAISELDVAFAGVISAGVIGMGSLIVTWKTAQATRAHERRLAHDARLYDQRSKVYLDVLLDLRSELRSLEALVEWTRDPEGPNPGVAFPTRKATDERNSRIAAFGSESMLARVREFHDELGGAWVAAYEERTQLTDTGELETNLVRMTEVLDDARKRLRDIDRQVREELTNPDQS